jgi:hypothetical protein
MQFLAFCGGEVFITVLTTARQFTYYEPEDFIPLPVYFKVNLTL